MSGLDEMREECEVVEKSTPPPCDPCELINRNLVNRPTIDMDGWDEEFVEGYRDRLVVVVGEDGLADYKKASEIGVKSGMDGINPSGWGRNTNHGGYHMGGVRA